MNAHSHRWGLILARNAEKGTYGVCRWGLICSLNAKGGLFRLFYLQRGRVCVRKAAPVGAPKTAEKSPYRRWRPKKVPIQKSP